MRSMSSVDSDGLLLGLLRRLLLSDMFVGLLLEGGDDDIPLGGKPDGEGGDMLDMVHLAGGTKESLSISVSRTLSNSLGRSPDTTAAQVA